MDPESPRMGCAIPTVLVMLTLFRVKPLMSHCLSRLLQSQSLMEKLCFPALVTHSTPGTVVTKTTLSKPHVLPGVGSDHEKAIKRYSNCQAICQRKPWSSIHMGRCIEGRTFFIVHSFIHFILSFLHRSNI